MEKIAIIAAAGSGSRMNQDIPKPFLKLNNQTVLEITLQKFLNIEGCKIILVLSNIGMEYWDKLGIQHDNIRVVLGGDTRYQSIKNAITTMNCLPSALVAVHDAARPLVSTELIERAFKTAELSGSAVPFIPIVDSLRKVSGKNTIPVDRNHFKLIQTPQVFAFETLSEAYHTAYTPAFTDDASVVEALFEDKVNFIPGSVFNFKITSLEDLKIARALLSKEEL